MAALLESGADPAALNLAGLSPLQSARLCKSAEVVGMLEAALK